MGHAGEGDDAIDLAGIMGGGVAGNDLDLWPGPQILAGRGRQAGIIFDRDHAPARPDNLAQHGAVVPGAGADLHDSLAGPQIQLIEQSGPEARLAIVQASCRIDRDEHVVIDPPRIGIRRLIEGSHSLRRNDVPRPWPEKPLARHRREGFDHRFIAPDRGGGAELLGKEAARLGQIGTVHRYLRHRDSRDIS